MNLDTQYDYIELQLDSQVATTSGTSLSSFDTPVFNLGRQISNIAAVKIIDVQIPFSYYVISSTSDNTGSLMNTLSFATPDSISASIRITPGNYTGTSLAATLTTLLTTACQAFPNYNSSFLVTFDSSTGKFIFTYTVGSGSTAGQFSFTFSTGVAGTITPLASILGFGIGTYTSTGDVLIAPNVAQVTGPNYIYVNSNYLGSILKCWLPQSTYGVVGQSNPQIAKIPVNCNPGGVIDWQDSTPNLWFDAKNLFQMLNIDLFLSLGPYSQTPITLNGLPFSIKLGLMVNTNTQTQNLAGTVAQNRVVKRAFGA